MTLISPLYSFICLSLFNRQAVCALFFVQNKYLKSYLSSESCSLDEIFRDFPQFISLSITSSPSSALTTTTTTTTTAISLSKDLEMKIKYTILVELISQILSVEDACMELQSMQELGDYLF